MERGAIISECGRYRYDLWRKWEAPALGLSVPCVMFVMLNPSTADGEVDDPTIRKCIGFAKRWGYGMIRVVNLFAYRSTKPPTPTDRRTLDLVGPYNVGHIRQAMVTQNTCVVAWGRQPSTLLGELPQTIAHEANELDLKLWCLGTTKNGSPRHPLFVPYDTPLQQWNMPA